MQRSAPAPAQKQYQRERDRSCRNDRRDGEKYRFLFFRHNTELFARTAVVPRSFRGLRFGVLLRRGSLRLLQRGDLLFQLLDFVRLLFLQFGLLFLFVGIDRRKNTPYLHDYNDRARNDNDKH